MTPILSASPLMHYFIAFRVLHTLAATQEVPRHTRSSSRSAIMVVSSAYLS